MKPKTQEAKEFLLQLNKLDKLIGNKLIEKEQWKSIALGTGAQMGGERVQSSGSQQKMADAIGRYIDMEAEIDRYIDRLIETKKDVIGVIEQLDAIEYDLLHVVYVQYLTLEDFAEKYDRTYRWAAGVHGRALMNVVKILEKRKQFFENFKQIR